MRSDPGLPQEFITFKIQTTLLLQEMDEIDQLTVEVEQLHPVICHGNYICQHPAKNTSLKAVQELTSNQDCDEHVLLVDSESALEFFIGKSLEVWLSHLFTTRK